MKNKLEAGIFIRTPLGIGKIIYLRIQDEYGCNYATQLEYNLFINNERDHISIDGECFEKEEIKTSYNIIDLIQEGDYVNGSKVGYIDDCDGAMREFYYDYENPNEDVGHWQEEIKSIVTREQFESMSYKVGE